MVAPIPPTHYEIQVQKFDTLFVLHNAGETNDLIPVINALKLKNENIGVLAIGLATDLIKDKLINVKVFTLKDLHIETPIDKFSPRNALLSLQEIDKISKLLTAKQLVTGVPSLIEAQLLQAYGKKRIKTFAYWDNFSSNGTDPYFSTAIKVQRYAKNVILPSQAVADSPEFSHRHHKEKFVVGKPSMKEWLASFNAINTDQIKTSIGIGKKTTYIATWIGGYGPEHKKAFELFVNCIKQLKRNERPDKLIFAQHPNATKDDLDPYSYFDKNDPMIVPEKHKISTVNAAAISNVVISYNSTDALQSILVGKKVFFVIPEDDEYSNIAIDNDLVHKVSDCSSFALAFTIPQSPINAWELLGIPEENEQSELKNTDSTSRFISVLTTKKNQNSLWDNLKRFFSKQ